MSTYHFIIHFCLHHLFIVLLIQLNSVVYFRFILSILNQQETLYGCNTVNIVYFQRVRSILYFDDKSLGRKRDRGGGGLEGWESRSVPNWRSTDIRVRSTFVKVAIAARDCSVELTESFNVTFSATSRSRIESILDSYCANLLARFPLILLGPFPGTRTL